MYKIDRRVRGLVEGRSKIITIESCLQCHLSHFTYPNLGEKMRISCTSAVVCGDNDGKPKFVGYFGEFVHEDGRPIPDWCPLESGRDFIEYLMVDSVVSEARKILNEANGEDEEMNEGDELTETKLKLIEVIQSLTATLGLLNENGNVEGHLEYVLQPVIEKLEQILDEREEDVVDPRVGLKWDAPGFRPP